MAARTIQQACTGYKGGALPVYKGKGPKVRRHLAGNTQGMEPCMALRKMIYDF